MQSDEVHDWIIHWLPRASGSSDENPSAMDAGVSAAIQRALMKPQGGELSNACIDRQELVEVVSLSNLSFSKQWIE